MKERDGVPKPVQSELTSEAVNPTLIVGEIFMPDEVGKNSAVPPPPDGEPRVGGKEGRFKATGKVLRGVGRRLFRQTTPSDEERQGALSRLLRYPKLPGDLKRVIEDLRGEPQPARDSGASAREQPRASQGTLNTSQELIDAIGGLTDAFNRASEGMQIQQLDSLQRLRSQGIDVDSIIEFDVVEDDEKKHKKLKSLKEHLDEASRKTLNNMRKGVETVYEVRSQLNSRVSDIATTEDPILIRRALDGWEEDSIDQQGKPQKIKIDGFITLVENVQKTIGPNERSEMAYKGTKGFDALMVKLKDPSTPKDEIKRIVEYLAPKIRAHYQTIEKKGEDMPRSLEDLVELIMSRASQKYREGGELALMQTVEGDGKNGEKIPVQQVSLAHFYEWVREQMWRVHDFNSNGEANFFSDEGMGVKTTYRTINFFEIVFTPSFFHQRRHLIQDTGKRKPNGEVEPEEGEENLESQEYEELRKMLLYEVYIFQLVRNGDWMYRDNRSGEKAMMQALEGIYKINPLTKDDYFERIFTMASMSKRALGETGSAGKQITEKKDNNFFMGEAVRRALGAYMSIWDYDRLVQFLGSNATLFKREYMDYDDGRPKEETEGGGENYNADRFFNTDGSLKFYEVKRNGKYVKKKGPDGKMHPVEDLSGNGKPHPDFMKHVNIFLGPQREQSQIKEVRDRMVLSIMEREGISYNEAKLAEAWAFALCHFTGVAARNDTASVGFDQWTKQANLMFYRFRQKAEQRRAPFGNKYTLEGLRRIALTFFEGARDDHDRAIFEIIQGGQGGIVDIENNPISKDIDFERRYATYQENDKTYIEFRDNKGKKVTKLKVVYPPQIDEEGKLTFVDENGKKVDTGIYHPTKRDIVFKDSNNQIVALETEVWGYEIDKKGNITYKDKDGNSISVDTQQYQTRVTHRDVVKPTFDTDTQRLFIANHMQMNTEWFDFVINGKEMDFLGMYKGYNSTGRPIIDQDKLTEVKKKIRKNITYALSTWPGVDYTKKIRDWYMEQERDEQGNLSRDDYGNPIFEKEPTIKEWSILESMFGQEVMAFIQLEINSERRGIKDLGIDVYDLESAHDRLDDEEKKKLKLAVWTGVFTYMVAKEIWSHRAWDSNLQRYGFKELKEVYDIISDGEFLYEDEIDFTRSGTKTGAKKVFGQEFMYSLGIGNLEGFWQMIASMFKQSLV